MPLIHMGDLLQHAHRHGYAVGAFDLVSLEFLEAILQGAESVHAPVILSVAESHFEHFDVELVLAASVAAARRAAIPVAIHLDHGASLESAIAAIRMGCNGVMVDASHLPFEENVARTREVVEMAHGCGVPVEGELGYVAGVEGEDAQKHPGEIIYTSPREAQEYVAQTGVDFLAVSIGTVHGRLRGEPRLDFERLAEINQRVNLPLVIHGGTGLSDEQYRRLIENGVAKINYYTALSDAAAAQIRRNASAHSRGSYTDLHRDVRNAIRREVERCLKLWGAEGRAEPVLAECRLWQEVEHVIEFNVPENLSGEAVHRIMEHGREVLSRIPGVRRVFIGEAVQQDKPYRYCWVIRFASTEVIDSYREHPDHVRYADEHFRPIAGDRITIDFKEI
ncbi:MAG: ketose-bisphosphate aldolase [Calditrichaeota bacterium]|nr:MAG: ketose-bisphosphate aldolase [Calditrichota bacterium]